MSKRVQYALSLPQLAAAPPVEADRAVVYAKPAGLFVRLPDGTEQGPFAAPPASSGGSVASIEVDFGVRAKNSHVVTLAVPGLVAGRPVVAVQSGDAATGRQADENELDMYSVNARAQMGALVLNIDSIAGSVLQGKSKVNYVVG